MKLCVYYVGYGLPGYRRWAKLMMESARDVMGDVKIVHITDRHTPQLEGSDGIIRAKEEVAWEKLASAKGQLIATVAQALDERAIFCDPDVIFNQDPRAVFSDKWDVGFCFRRSSPHKCFNTGMIFTTPKAAPFWSVQRDMVERMCTDVDDWWSDQLTLACLLGMEHEPDEVVNWRNQVRVACLDYEWLCPKPQSYPMQVMPSYASHFTGEDRKQWIEQYAHLRGLPSAQPPAARDHAVVWNQRAEVREVHPAPGAGLSA